MSATHSHTLHSNHTPPPLPTPPPPAKELSHVIVSLSMASSIEEGVATAPSAGFLCMYATICDVMCGVVMMSCDVMCGVVVMMSCDVMCGVVMMSCDVMCGVVMM